MPVWPRAGYGVAADTAWVASAAFPCESMPMCLRGRLGELFSDSAFTELYARRGRPGFSPASLALVSVLQFMENLTDRQAANAVYGRIDWKYALGLGLARDPECGRGWARIYLRPDQPGKAKWEEGGAEALRSTGRPAGPTQYWLGGRRLLRVLSWDSSVRGGL